MGPARQPRARWPEKLKTYVYGGFDWRVSAFEEAAGGLTSTTPAHHTLYHEWNVQVQQESPQGSGGTPASQSPPPAHMSLLAAN